MTTTAREVAIVGYACRLPQADGPDEFWRVLQAGRCVIGSVQDDRWSRSRFGHVDRSVAGKSYTWRAGQLDRPFDFDPMFFGISPREALQMDPQQRLMLKVVWEALEHAGIPASDLAGRDVGVYVGASSVDYSNQFVVDLAATDIQLMTGNTLSILSNRVSYVLDLKGPSFTVDTACSSSIVALHEALEAIRSGRIDTAVVGGVNMLLSPFAFVGFSRASMLSPTGLCRAFDAKGDGYVRSEGAVALVLQSVEAARAAGNPVRGVLVGSGINSDGRTAGLSLPSSQQQAALLHHVYDRFGIDPALLAFVEAHGTGTRVGDPAEAEALGKVLGRGRREPLPIGSVKTNIGHLEAASGLAGLLKAQLALEHGVLPASLHFETPNPDIDFEGLNVRVAAEAVALRSSEGPLHAGLNSFGFGGANAHAVLRQPTSAEANRPARAVKPAPLVISAQSPEALRSLATVYRGRLAEADDEAVAVVANAAAHGRDRLDHRLVTVGTDASSIRAALDDFLAGRQDGSHAVARAAVRRGAVAFVFAGNGSQWVGMGRTAYETNSSFRATFDAITQLFLREAGWSLNTALFSPDSESEFDRTEVAQPLLFAIQVAIVDALAARGLSPDMVAGHSVGEVAAAYVSGALDLTAAVRLVHVRSMHQEVTRHLGSMAAVLSSAASVEAAILAGGYRTLELAADNSPRSVTISGTPDELSAFGKDARQRRWAMRRLKIDYPFHCALIEPIRAPLTADLAELKPRATRIPLVSTVTGTVVEGRALDPDYWWRNVRQPVLFRPAVERLAELGARVFVEIGPRPVLRTYLTDTLDGIQKSGAVLASLDEGQAGGAIFSRIVAEALANGATVNEAVVFGPKASIGEPLPHYPWQEQTYRVEQSRGSADFFGRGDDHPLLGYRLLPSVAHWTAHVDSTVVPWLADHKVESSTVLPAAGFVEMILSAARAALGDGPLEIRDLDILRPLVLEDGETVEVRTEIDPTGGLIDVASRPRLSPDASQINVKARIARSPSRPPVPVAVPAQVGSTLDAETLYRLTRRFGLDYGPAFRRAKSVAMVGERSLYVTLSAETAAGMADTAFALAPTLLDASFHGLFVLIDRAVGADEGVAFLPIRFDRLRLYRAGETAAGALVTIDRASPRSVEACFTLLAADGAVVAEASGVRFRAVPLVRRVDPDGYVYTSRTLRLIEPDGSVELSPAWGSAPKRLADLGLSAEEVEPDDASLLIDAASRGIAAAALNALADRSGHVLIDSLVARGSLCSSALSLLYRLGNALVEDDAAERTAEGFRMPDDTPYPDPGALIAALTARHPQRIAEAMALISVRRTLPNVLRTGLLEEESAVLGPVLTGHLETSAPIGAPLHQSLVTALSDLAKSWPGDRPLRILLAGAGCTEIVRTLCAFATPSRIVVTDPDHGRLERIRLDLETAGIVEVRGFDDLTAEAGRCLFDVAAIVDLSSRAEAGLNFEGIGQLLAPGGLLLGTEPEPSLFGDMINGQCASWWRSSLDPSAPLGMRRSVRGLKRLLTNAGFRGVEITPLASSTTAARILSAHWDGSPAWQPGAQMGPVVILVDADESARRMADALAAALSERGRPVRVAVATSVDDGSVRIEAADAGSDEELQALLSGDAVKDLVYQPTPTDHPDDPSSVVLGRMMALHAVMNGMIRPPARLWIVAPGGSGAATDRQAHRPVEAATWGFGRVLMNEYPDTETRLVDLVMAFAPSEAAERMADLLAHPSAERELAVDVRGVSAIRIVSGPGLADQAAAALSGGAVARTLTIDRQGTLDGLAWRTVERHALGDDEVEIEVSAAGLNFRDVMWALGLLPEEALENGFAGATLGMECSGTIVRTGPGVTRVRPGDKVITFAPACFSTHVIVSEKALAPVPITVDLEAAATIPVTFLTAYYALVELAKLGEDETVLIHGGAGGVGLAALQVALSRGARVIATAGSQDRRELISLLGVDHVLDSRSLTFADDVMALTDGAGVDVVLNSLSGEAMERSLSVLKPFGRFVELGKRDYYANTHVGLRPFRQNLSYFGVDADQLLTYRPKLTERLFRELVEGFESGVFTALPYRVFPAERITEAFRLMQQAGHVGKIVVRPPALSSSAAEPVAIRPDATYLIVGGLGGFGIETARFLFDRGARHLVLTGRSGRLSEAAALAVSAMEAKGGKVLVAALDVTDAGAVEALLRRVDGKMPPLKGILHTAMVIDDALFQNLDARRIEAVLAPKIRGAAVLDRVSRRYELDLFVLYSSATTLIGNPGQAPYVAANAWLEGLARSRRAEGLPALAIAWGAIADAGYLTRNAGVNEVLSMRLGKQSLTAKTALAGLGMALDAGVPAPVIAYAEIDWTSARKELPIMAAPLMSLVASRAFDGGLDTVGDGELATMIEGLDGPTAVRVVTEVLAGEISRILRLPPEDIDPSRPLTEIGMDSLMALELRMAAERRLGIDIPLLSLANGAALGDIARRIVEKGEAQGSEHVELATARHVGEGIDDELLSALQEVEMRAADVKRVI